MSEPHRVSDAAESKYVSDVSWSDKEGRRGGGAGRAQSENDGCASRHDRYSKQQITRAKSARNLGRMQQCPTIRLDPVFSERAQVSEHGHHQRPQSSAVRNIIFRRSATFSTTRNLRQSMGCNNEERPEDQTEILGVWIQPREQKGGTRWNSGVPAQQAQAQSQKIAKSDAAGGCTDDAAKHAQSYPQLFLRDHSEDSPVWDVMLEEHLSDASKYNSLCSLDKFVPKNIHVDQELDPKDDSTINFQDSQKGTCLAECEDMLQGLRHESRARQISENLKAVNMSVSSSLSETAVPRCKSPTVVSVTFWQQPARRDVDDLRAGKPRKAQSTTALVPSCAVKRSQTGQYSQVSHVSSSKSLHKGTTGRQSPNIFQSNTRFHGFHETGPHVRRARSFHHQHSTATAIRACFDSSPSQLQISRSRSLSRPVTPSRPMSGKLNPARQMQHNQYQQLHGFTTATKPLHSRPSQTSSEIYSCLSMVTQATGEPVSAAELQPINVSRLNRTV